MTPEDASPAGATLPAGFIDWWFDPWPADGADAQGLLARRDAYRLRCRREGIAPDLPAGATAAWPAVLGAGGDLSGAARLYAGLLAARQQDADLLAGLAPDERAWCLRLAAIQPLAACAPAAGLAGATLAIRGLAELACQLEHGFPGLWQRLSLAQPDRAAVAAALAASAPGARVPAPAAAARARRCWLMCRARSVG